MEVNVDQQLHSLKYHLLCEQKKETHAGEEQLLGEENLDFITSTALHLLFPVRLTCTIAAVWLIFSSPKSISQILLQSSQDDSCLWVHTRTVWFCAIREQIWPLMFSDDESDLLWPLIQLIHWKYLIILYLNILIGLISLCERSVVFSCAAVSSKLRAHSAKSTL